MATPGEVYVYHHCFLRGLVKIGFTTRTAEARAAELRTTAFPGDFIVLFSWWTSNADEVERRLHKRLDEYRVDRKREFFQITPKRAISALLEEVGVVDKITALVQSSEDVLPMLVDTYGPLLDTDLTSVTVELGDGMPTSLICCLDRFGDQVVLRRDMDFIHDGIQPYFTAATDAPAAARLLLALDPYSLVMTTPLFSERGGQLIADLHERAKLNDQEIKEVVSSSRTGSGVESIEAVEALIWSKLRLPAR